MSIGQLYYYQAQLNKLTKGFDKNTLLNLDFPGKKYLSITSKSNLSTIKRQVRDIFSQNYSIYLRENNMLLAKNLWDMITSPVYLDNITSPEGGFTAKVEDWLMNNLDTEQIPHLVREGQLSTDEDFALAYGLNFVYLLSQKSDHNNTFQPISLTSKLDSNIGSKSGLLVITTPDKAPLFLNLNSGFLDYKNDNQAILNEVESYLEKNPELELILIDNINPDQKTVEFLEKRLSKSIRITSLDFGYDSENNYFDKLVMDTLGVRLVD